MNAYFDKDKLLKKIHKDLEIIGINMRSPLILRRYSKRRWGYYDVLKDEIVVYVFSDMLCTRLTHYNILFRIVLHEYTHLLQHKSSNWVRYKNVMHDVQFWQIYNNLVDLAVERGIIYGRRKA